MSFSSPIALLALILVPLAAVGYVLFERTARARGRRASSSPRCCRTSSTGCRAGGGTCRRRSCCSPWPRSCRLRAPARDGLGALRGGDRDHRDRHVALDGRDRRPADPARGRPGFGAPVPRGPARQVPRLGRRLQHARAGRGRADDRPRLRRRRDLGTARRRGHRARRRARDRGRGRPRDAGGRQAARGREAGRRRSSSCSRTARSTAAASSCPRRSAARATRRSPCSRRCSAPRPASSRCRTSAATSSASRCRRIPPRCAASPRQTGGSFFAAPTAKRSGHRVRRPEVAPRLARTRTRRSRSPSRAPARCCCSAAASSRRCGSGGSRDPRGGSCGRAWPWRSSPAFPPGRPRTSARGCMVCIPVAGPWVEIPAPGARRCRERRPGDSSARAASSAASTRAPASRAVAVEFPGRIGSPVNPGITTTRSLVFKGTYAGPRRPAHEPTGRSSAAFPGAAAGRARRRAFTRASAVKPGEPITVARHDAARASRVGSPRRRSAAAPGERLLRSAPQRRPLHRGACRRRRSSPPSASCASRGSARARQRDAAAGLPAGRAGRGAGTGGVREVRFEWPLVLLALLIVPLAVAGLPRARAAARPLRRPLHEHRGARRGRGGRRRAGARTCPPALAALALIFALVALARPEIQRTVASEEASIALTVDVSGSMQADDVKPTRLGAAQEAIRRFLDQAARQVPRRPRHLLVASRSSPRR